MYDVRDITNAILDHAERDGVEITNLALQKLLYFIHGWFYSIFDEPLIKNKFEAWQYGPVQRVIYDQFKQFKNKPLVGIRATHLNPISGESEYKKPEIKSEHAEVIYSVLERYSKFSVSQLVEQSHVEDGPWEYVWNQAEDTVFPGMRIPDSMILEHFKRIDPILTIH